MLTGGAYSGTGRPSVTRRWKTENNLVVSSTTCYCTSSPPRTDPWDLAFCNVGDLVILKVPLSASTANRPLCQFIRRSLPSGSCQVRLLPSPTLEPEACATGPPCSRSWWPRPPTVVAVINARNEGRVGRGKDGDLPKRPPPIQPVRPSARNPFHND